MSNEYIFSVQSDIIAVRGRPIYLGGSKHTFYETVLQLQLPDHVVDKNLPKNVVLKIEYSEKQRTLRSGQDGPFQQRGSNLRPTSAAARNRHTEIPRLREYHEQESAPLVRCWRDSDGQGLDSATDFEGMVFRSLRLIRQHGVQLEYLDPCNVHLCGDTLYIVDLEHAELIPPDVSDEEEKGEGSPLWADTRPGASRSNSTR
ncbi:hypothetical protein BDP55DRAFT_713393 [Colletotrichum godetiae]|uniref:Uncharacterized protein n=1 Tax=Colletotrichum godetiae TaxID=1209918 RepID=A0AAJ0AS02_9PEZI|nr:uncharacterized protein BDP55DRAFT_713393 [Colletotrichum godetiae]KAK1688577.1 hypothetical protein BDP55DRAFT_713393 [Colletotrichum godetiae]